MLFQSESPSLKICLENEIKIDRPIQFDAHFYFTEDEKIIENLLGIIQMREKTNRKKEFDVFKKRNIEKVGKKRKILLQRLGGLGDMIFILPLAEYFHSLGHEVDFYGHFAYWQIFQNNPYINKIWVNAELQARADGNLNVPEKMTIEQYGTYDRPYSFVGSIECNKNAELVHATEACYEWANIDPKGKPMKPTLIVTEEEKMIAYQKLLKDRGFDPFKKIIGIAPNATAYNRSYPHGQWLTEELEDDYNVIQIHWGEKWKKSDSHCWDIREAMSIISVCDLMITSDTGMLHVAGGLDIPTIALFGPFNPEIRTKYYEKCKVICPTLKVCDDFCYNHLDECKKLELELISPPCMDIDPYEIIEKVKEMI